MRKRLRLHLEDHAAGAADFLFGGEDTRVLPDGNLDGLVQGNVPGRPGSGGVPGLGPGNGGGSEKCHR